MAAYVYADTTRLNDEELHHSRGRHRARSLACFSLWERRDATTGEGIGMLSCDTWPGPLASTRSRPVPEPSAETCPLPDSGVGRHRRVRRSIVRSRGARGRTELSRTSIATAADRAVARDSHSGTHRTARSDRQRRPLAHHLASEITRPSRVRIGGSALIPVGVMAYANAPSANVLLTHDAGRHLDLDGSCSWSTRNRTRANG